MKNLAKIKLTIIGLGYVGLPLAIEFAKKYDVVGFDINPDRIEELLCGNDETGEANLKDLKSVTQLRKHSGIGLTLSSNIKSLLECCIFIVTVPTPISRFKTIDLSALLKASKMLGEVIKKNDIIIYESTVYPGCTEEDCVPEIEKSSSLIYNKDFFVGYSPERVNPGDKINTLTNIKKVTSGSTPEIAEFVDSLYASIITAGTYKAQSIKVAEASKAIENAQRDINISFVNELAIIFDRMNIDTNDVLAAASTKWNFLNFKPGLVGGHCIGVDPYYLAYKAQSLGYHPQVILSGRRVNDNMGIFIANKVVKLLIKKEKKVMHCSVLILGITFKENCADVRNSRVPDIYNELCTFGICADIYDPLANKKEVSKQCGIDMLTIFNDETAYDAIIVAVAHKEFLTLNYDKFKLNGTIIFDTKALLDRNLVDGRL